MAATKFVTLRSTQEYILKSSTVGRSFRISIALPASYDNSEASSYPVIYLLDAGWHFGAVTDMTRMMSAFGKLDETIIVGIGYPFSNQLNEAFQKIVFQRITDLSPAKDEAQEQRLNERLNRTDFETGGGPTFLSFIKSELLPFVESRFKVNASQCTLAGHSLGGSFALYTMFHDTGLFQNYLAASPGLFVADYVPFRYEEAFAMSNDTLPVNLYLSVGEDEEDFLPQYGMVSDFFKFTALLKGRDYGKLCLVSELLRNCDHGASAVPAFQNGLRFFYSPR